MPDFIFDTFPEETEASAAPKYAATPPTLGEAAAGLLYHEPTSAMLRAADTAAYDPSASLLQSFLAGVEPQAGLTEQSLRAPASPLIEPSETAKFDPEGKPLSDKPIPRELAVQLGKQRQEKIEADSAIKRFDDSHAWTTNVALSLGVGMADPLNISTMLLPVLGEEAVAARLGLTGFVGRALARGIAGAASGPVMQAPVSAAELAFDPDYGLRQAFYDMAFQAPLTAAVGASILGLPLEGLRALRGAAASTTHAGMSAATAQLVEGKPVDVGFIPGPPTFTSFAAAQGRPPLRRPEAIEGFEFLPPTIDDALPVFAERQKALAENGYAPGMPEGGLVEAAAEVAAMPEPEPPKVEGPPPDWALPTEPAPMPEEAGTPRAQAYERLPSEPPRLVQFLREREGVIDEGGDIRSTLGGSRFRPGLINQRGMTLDDAALAAWEAGYFPEHATRPSINDLRDAIAADLEGVAKYSEQDREAVAAHQTALAGNQEIDRISQETGIDARGRTREQFWDAVRDHVSLEQELKLSEERFAALESALAEGGEGRRFVGEPRSLEDMEREYRQEEAARPATAGTAGAGRSGRGAGVEADRETGARPVRGGAGAEPEPRRSTLTELTDQGEQFVIPGAERTARQAAAAREQQGRGMMRAGAEQAEPGGMFAPKEAEQASLFAEFPELAAAEQKLAELDQASFLPEERAALAATDEEMQKAVQIEGAFQEAANCLKDAGA